MEMHDPTSDLFRQVWSRFTTGVTVITTMEPDDRSVHGMTANGVTSVSLDPPLMLAVIAHERNTHPLIVKNQRFGISILSAGQQYVARHFTAPPEERIELQPVPMTRLGESMVIAEALAAMDCRVVHSHEAGDHTIFVAEAEKMMMTELDPLIYFRSNFTRLGTVSESSTSWNT